MTWRVAITEPTNVLHPAVVGSQWWVMWGVFAAFALGAAPGLYLLRRTLGGATQLADQAHDVEHRERSEQDRHGQGDGNGDRRGITPDLRYRRDLH